MSDNVKSIVRWEQYKPWGIYEEHSKDFDSAAQAVIFADLLRSKQPYVKDVRVGWR